MTSGVGIPTDLENWGVFFFYRGVLCFNQKNTGGIWLWHRKLHENYSFLSEIVFIILYGGSWGHRRLFYEGLESQINPFYVSKLNSKIGKENLI